MNSDTRQWYYHYSGQTLGPVTSETIAQLLNSGYLTPETMVWTETLKEWTPVNILIPTVANISSPPLVSQTKTQNWNHQKVNETDEISQIRPWVRFWARIADYEIVWAVLSLILILFSIKIIWGIVLIVYLSIPICWLFIEPLFLSQYGATPGKMLLNTHVWKDDGALPTYAEALGRSVNVWIRGTAFYIPPILFITWIIAFAKLKSRGETTWDKQGGFLIEHDRIGVGRVIALIVLLVICRILESLAIKI